MKNRKVIAGLLLTAVGVAPAFVFATPASAADQTQTQEKQHKGRKGQTMTLDQLPQPVQQTINQEAQGGTVGTIKQETARGGKTFYVAEVTDQSGKKHHVRVNEDGSLMKSRSARANKENSSSSQSTTK